MASSEGSLESCSDRIAVVAGKEQLWNSVKLCRWLQLALKGENSEVPREGLLIPTLAVMWWQVEANCDSCVRGL